MNLSCFSIRETNPTFTTQGKAKVTGWYNRSIWWCGELLWILMQRYIFQNTVAVWIQLHMKLMIDHWPVGFLLGMQGWFNVQNSLNMIFCTCKDRHKKSYDHLCACTKNTCNAFNKMKSSFMMKKKIVTSAWHYGVLD